MKQQFLNFTAWAFYHLGLLSYKDYENYKINRAWIFSNVRLI